MKLILNGQKPRKGSAALQSESVQKIITYLEKLKYGLAFNSVALAVTLDYGSPSSVDHVGALLRAMGMFEIYAYRKGTSVIWASPKTIKAIRNGKIEL